MISDPRPIIAIDTETGGLSPDTAELLSVAAIRLDPNTLEERGRWSAYIMPERPDRVDARAAALNGFSVDRWRDRGARPLVDVMRSFWRFCGGKSGCDIAAHNAPFDVGFLTAALRAVRAPSAPWVLELDTVALCRLLGVKNLSLRGCCAAFGVPYSRAAAHDALYDAERVALLIQALRSRDARRPLPTRAHADSPGICEHCQAALVWRRNTPLDAATLQPHRLTCPHASKWSPAARRAANFAADMRGRPSERLTVELHAAAAKEIERDQAAVSEVAISCGSPPLHVASEVLRDRAAAVNHPADEAHAADIL